jgi:hypothetical protein
VISFGKNLRHFARSILYNADTGLHQANDCIATTSIIEILCIEKKIKPNGYGREQTRRSYRKKSIFTTT